MTSDTYTTLLDWLYSAQTFGIKLGLDNTKKLLRQFKAYPSPGVKVVHVAGTNGKGSTCAMAESVARACGYKTGLFTSPHLIDFRERIRVNGDMISSDDLASLLRQIRNLVSSWDTPPTFFELSLALALKYFSQQEVEIIFLETGMGGRLDATNAIPKDIAVLTPIALDHTQYLGSTLEEIAEEKAAIIAYDKPVITAPQSPEALDIIQQIAGERRAPLVEITDPLLGYAIALPGSYQQYNAALATAALHSLGIELRTDNVAFGLGQVTWPGRFEYLRDDLIIDGAHNPSAAETLVRTWREFYGEAKTALIFATVADKDVKCVLDLLLPLAHTLILPPMQSPRALSPEDIRAFIPESFKGDIRLPDSLPTLIDQLNSSEPSTSSISPSTGVPYLATGSLYFIGELSAHLLGNGASTRPSAQ